MSRDAKMLQNSEGWFLQMDSQFALADVITDGMSKPTFWPGLLRSSDRAIKEAPVSQ